VTYAEAVTEAADTWVGRDAEQVPAMYSTNRLQRPVRADTPTRRRVPDIGRHRRSPPTASAGVCRNHRQLGWLCHVANFVII